MPETGLVSSSIGMSATGQTRYQEKVRGAENPVYCNREGVCGAVLGMGKVRSSSSMTAILLDPRFDFLDAYFIISGVGGRHRG